MGYEPKFSDTAIIRMKQHNLQQWQVVRAFESSDRKHGDDNSLTGRAEVDGKLVTAVYKKLDNGDYLIITCWATDLKKPDELYRQRYGKYPKRS